MVEIIFCSVTTVILTLLFVCAPVYYRQYEKGYESGWQDAEAWDCPYEMEDPDAVQTSMFDRQSADSAADTQD